MTDRSPSKLPDFDGIRRQFDAEIGQARTELGRINIAVFGNTGVGKSTLLNAVFGRNLAATGSGDSVTAHIQYHGGPDAPLGIYDTPGFEIGGDYRGLTKEITQIFADNARRPLHERIHVVWFVENAQTNRFVDAQADIVEHLAGFGVPVMMILTRVRRTADGGYPAGTHQLAKSIVDRDLPLTPRGRVFLVNAVADPELGDPAHGLTRLLDATFAAVPPEVHQALIAAQRLDLERKRQAATAVIRRFTVASAAAGATPIPVADLLLVTTSLTRMFARISAVYGIPFHKRQMARLAAAVLLTGGASHATSTAITRASAKQLAKLAAGQAGKQAGKLVPVANAVVAAAAGASSAMVARAAGHAWSRVCEYLLRHPEEDPSLDAAVLDTFRRYFPPRRARRSVEAPPQEPPAQP